MNKMKDIIKNAEKKKQLLKLLIPAKRQMYNKKFSNKSFEEIRNLAKKISLKKSSSLTAKRP